MLIKSNNIFPIEFNEKYTVHTICIIIGIHSFEVLQRSSGVLGTIFKHPALKILQTSVLFINVTLVTLAFAMLVFEKRKCKGNGC